MTTSKGGLERQRQRVDQQLVLKQVRKAKGRFPAGEIGKLLRLILYTPGWRIGKMGGHYRAYSPDGKSIVTIPTSPGGGNRSLDNLRARLKQAGLEWRNKQEQIGR